jgi:hypothetical protein
MDPQERDSINTYGIVVPDSTGASLVSFIEQVAEAKIFNQTTIKQVLAITTRIVENAPQWQSRDIRVLDAHEMVEHHFQDKGAYIASTIMQYERNLRQALEMFRAYSDSDPAWTTYGPKVRVTTRHTHDIEKWVNNRQHHDSELASAIRSPQSLRRYTVPIRADLDAVLVLPSNLTSEEASHLATLLHALAKPEQVNIPAPAIM